MQITFEPQRWDSRDGAAAGRAPSPEPDLSAWGDPTAALRNGGVFRARRLTLNTPDQGLIRSE